MGTINEGLKRGIRVILFGAALRKNIVIAFFFFTCLFMAEINEEASIKISIILLECNENVVKHSRIFQGLKKKKSNLRSCVTLRKNDVLYIYIYIRDCLFTYRNGQDKRGNLIILESTSVVSHQ